MDRQKDRFKEVEKEKRYKKRKVKKVKGLREREGEKEVQENHYRDFETNFRHWQRRRKKDDRQMDRKGSMSTIT